jgi:hypothetical protein
MLSTVAVEHTTLDVDGKQLRRGAHVKAEGQEYGEKTHCWLITLIR